MKKLVLFSFQNYGRYVLCQWNLLGNASREMKLSFYKTHCTPCEIVSCYDDLKDGL